MTSSGRLAEGGGLNPIPVRQSRSGEDTQTDFVTDPFKYFDGLALSKGWGGSMAMQSFGGREM